MSTSRSDQVRIETGEPGSLYFNALSSRFSRI